jgi:hypothetical protein
MTVIKFRRGTAAQWTSANPILSSGEPGFETDTNKQKIGNGTTPWNSLAYVTSGTGGTGGGAVSSVNAYTGDVILTKADVGLANVSNLTPAAMPISTATQAALDSLSVGSDVGLAQLPPGSSIVVDYYKAVYGAANAWPTVRPTARTDLDVTWRGPTDPGNIALVGDILDLTSA